MGHFGTILRGLNSDQVISSAEQLEELEQTVCNLSDQLQAIIIEERLQSSFDFSLQKIPVGGGALRRPSNGFGRGKAPPTNHRCLETD